MKIKIILTTTLMLALTALQAQTKPTSIKPTTVDQCLELKKENENLKKALNLNEPISILNNSDIEFKVIKVIGDTKSQMVTIELLLTNKIKNREISITKGAIKIVNLDGEVLTLEKYVLPEQQAFDIYGIHVFLNTDVPIKCSFTFGPTLPSNQFLKLFNLPFTIVKESGSSENEFKDLKIEWK